MQTLWIFLNDDWKLIYSTLLLTNCHSSIFYLIFYIFYCSYDFLCFISIVHIFYCTKHSCSCCLFCLLFIWLIGFLAQYLHFFIFLFLHSIVKQFELHPLYYIIIIIINILLLNIVKLKKEKKIMKEPKITSHCWSFVLTLLTMYRPSDPHQEMLMMEFLVTVYNPMHLPP